MAFQRGDIGLARFPHASGGRGKRRPVVIVQADHYNQTLRHLVVAEVTKNLNAAADPANLLIDLKTPEGQATGLAFDSVITCLHLITMSEDRINPIIGKLPPPLLQKLNNCLKAVLDLP